MIAGQAFGQSASDNEAGTQVVPPDFRIRNKRIHQSVMGWCFNPMPTSELIDHCVAVGLEGIEGIDRRFYPEATSKGLKIALVSSHGFAQGPCNPKFREETITKLTDAIDVAKAVGCKRVIRCCYKARVAFRYSACSSRSPLAAIR